MLQQAFPLQLSTRLQKTYSFNLVRLYLTARAVCPKQTAYFFIPYLSHRYSTKARILETEPKTPIASLILEVICTTPPSENISRKGFTRNSIPHLAGVMATVFLDQDETVDSYKIYSSQKAHGCKGNRRFDMHGFDHTGQQNDSLFGTWLMPCPDFFLSSTCRRWKNFLFMAMQKVLSSEYARKQKGTGRNRG